MKSKLHLTVLFILLVQTMLFAQENPEDNTDQIEVNCGCYPSDNYDSIPGNQIIIYDSPEIGNKAGESSLNVFELLKKAEEESQADSKVLDIEISGISFQSTALDEFYSYLVDEFGLESVQMNFNGQEAYIQLITDKSGEAIWDGLPSDLRIGFNLVEISANWIRLQVRDHLTILHPIQ